MSLELQVTEYVATGLVSFGPILGLVLARRRLGMLNAASWLVVWGAFIVASEHTSFTIAGTLFSPQSPHTRFHTFMAGVYTAVGAILLIMMAVTMLRRGERVGWYATLLALIIGGGADLVMVATWLPHGALPPASQPTGIALYAYHTAWQAALAISYRPIFTTTRVTT